MVFYEEEIHRSIIIYADGNSISEMLDQQDPLEEFEIVEGGYKGASESLAPGKISAIAPAFCLNL